MKWFDELVELEAAIRARMTALGLVETGSLTRWWQNTPSPEGGFWNGKSYQLLPDGGWRSSDGQVHECLADALWFWRSPTIPAERIKAWLGCALPAK